MNKNEFAKRPPLGWNSWDVYGAAVTEEELMANARFFAEHLKDYGWEYVVCDIQWSEPDAVSMEYRPFVPLEMDEYSRLIPAVKRFPSAAGGKGFSVIAEQIHAMGLKFGIHIMRGIPRQAVHANTPILGTDKRARDIAHTHSICLWNTDMYGVDPEAEGAQEYYDSLFQLYASWGVDFVKVDDICHSRLTPEDPYKTRGEVELIHHAIEHCGRPMVLSLSPGPAVVEEAEHYCKYANMWRMTDDFWDHWPALYNMFDRCHKWERYVGEGCWPDCDMLPLGRVSLRNDPRTTLFTKDEQITMLSLWSIFRSPMMIGSELPTADEFTLSLLQNPEVLAVNQEGMHPVQVKRTVNHIVWKSENPDGSLNVALFNIGEHAALVPITLKELGLEGTFEVRDLWKRELIGREDKELSLEVPAHGAMLIKLFS